MIFLLLILIHLHHSFSTLHFSKLNEYLQKYQVLTLFLLTHLYIIFSIYFSSYQTSTIFTHNTSLYLTDPITYLSPPAHPSLSNSFLHLLPTHHLPPPPPTLQLSFPSSTSPSLSPQNPKEADSMMRIQADLDDTKVILVGLRDDISLYWSIYMDIKTA